MLNYTIRYNQQNSVCEKLYAQSWVAKLKGNEERDEWGTCGLIAQKTPNLLKKEKRKTKPQCRDTHLDNKKNRSP